MSRTQLLDIAPGHVLQRDPQCIRRDRKAPERVAEFQRHGLPVERASLKQVLSYVCQDLAGFLRQPRGGVEEALVVVEPEIDRASSLRLIPVQSRRVLQA